MNNQDDSDGGHARIPAGRLDLLRDDGGYRGSGVGTADQPSVVRAIAACLERHGDYRDIHSDYRDIHRRYVELLGACGFTPAGRVSAKGVDGNHPPSFHPTTEKRLKRQASETLLETCGFACADLQANRPTLGQTHQRYGDCVVQFRDAKGRDQFTAIVQGSWRDVADLRTYRWSKIATRRGGQDAPLETRERKALKVWVRTTGSSDRRR